MISEHGAKVAWLESKRLLASPRLHIGTLQRLIADDDDPLLLADYDDVSDPTAVAILRTQQRAAGQHRRQWRRRAARQRYKQPE